MVKRFFSTIGDSIKKYMLDTIIHSMLLKNGAFNAIFFWGMLLAIIIADIMITTGKNQGLIMPIVSGLTVALFFIIIGYVLFLVFDFIPMRAIIKRILPIREKLDEVITNSEITKHSFTGSYEIENIDKIIRLERVPADKVLEVWLYKLKVQRNTYVILSPLFYLMLTTVSMMLQNTHVNWIDSIYNFFDNLIKSPPAILQMLKWAFIVNVVTNEAININIDISRVELLKGLSKK